MKASLERTAAREFTNNECRPRSRKGHGCRDGASAGYLKWGSYDPAGKTCATWYAFVVTIHLPSMRWNIR